MTPIERAHLEAELAREGFYYERLSEVYESRAACNLREYTKLNEILNKHFDDCGGVLDCHKVQQLFD
jgi:hypothetical protein